MYNIPRGRLLASTPLNHCFNCQSGAGPFLSAPDGPKQILCSTCGARGPYENKKHTAEQLWNSIIMREPKFKPLVWIGKEQDCFVTSEPAIGLYELSVEDALERVGDYSWRATYYQHGKPGVCVNPGDDTFDEAKAAAQQHHNNLISSYIM